MEENMEVMTDEVTTPQTDMAEDAGGESEPAETTAEGDNDDRTEDTTPAEDQADLEARESEAHTLPVKFRHESRELTMEEATSYAQMGLKYESMQPTMDKLRMMASGRGQSLEEFVSAWAAAEERATMERLLQKTGGDRETAEKLLRLEQADRQKACETRTQQEKKAEEDHRRALTVRLAHEFGELQKEFPALGNFDDLPDAVINDAVKNDRHLLDAYLRHDRREQTKIEQNRAAQTAAAAASAGSQMDTPPANTMDAATAAMLRGIRSVFG